jgi:cell division protein FtsB
VKILQLHNFRKFFKKNTRFLPSIFLLVILSAIINQICITNNLPQLSKEFYSQNQLYKQKLEQTKREKKYLENQLNLVVRNKEGIESSARYQLGFIKTGEKFYYFPK